MPGVIYFLDDAWPFRRCVTYLRHQPEEWAEVCKMRQEELIAIADTVKILNDDDALELFKKTVHTNVHTS